MNDAKYSILFMRDDLDVRRFRLNPFWLKALVTFFTLLVALSAAGVYFGTTSLMENLELRKENRELKLRLEEAELRLSTLGNMERILEAYDSRDLESLLRAEPPGAEEQPQPSEGTDAKPAVDLSEVFAKVDTGAVRLEDLSLSLSAERLDVRFNLLNNLDNTQLSGDTHLALVTNEGQIIELDTTGADLTFQIQRRKPMRARITLPQELDKDDVFGLRLTVKREDGKVVFSETYPRYRLD